MWNYSGKITTLMMMKFCGQKKKFADAMKKIIGHISSVQTWTQC